MRTVLGILAAALALSCEPPPRAAPAPRPSASARSRFGFVQTADAKIPIESLLDPDSTDPDVVAFRHKYDTSVLRAERIDASVDPSLLRADGDL